MERSIVLRKGATCTLSDESGVEGVAGEGEREVDAACEEEEEDMIKGGRGRGKKERWGREWRDQSNN